MSATLGTVFQGEAMVEIPLNGETLTVWYNQAHLTPEFEALARDHDEKGQQGPFIVKMFQRLVKRWNLTADTDEHAKLVGVKKGDVVPLTDKALFKLPMQFLLKIVTAVGEDQRPLPNAEAPVSSGSFSSSTDDGGSVPTATIS